MRNFLIAIGALVVGYVLGTAVTVAALLEPGLAVLAVMAPVSWMTYHRFVR